MSEPFESAPARGDTRFRDPHEEIAYLRAQVAEKERNLAALGHTPEKEAVASQELATYSRTKPHEVLHESHQLGHDEVQAIALELPPDDDDAAMQELLHIVEEKGVKNALSVVDEMRSPHLADDFHRALVQYVLKGYRTPELREKTPLWNTLHMSLFEVTMPSMVPQGQTERPFRELVSSMEQFYLGLFSSDEELATRGDRYFTVEVAVSGHNEHIVFYMAVPRDKEDLFEKHLTSVFPKARAHKVPEDYNIFTHDGYTAAAYATLSDDPILPIKLYDEFDHDPLSVLINALTKIAPVGEGAAVQFVINPIGDVYLKRYRKVLEKLEKGVELRSALKDTPEGMGGEVVKALREFVTPKKDKPIDEEDDQKVHNQTVIEEVKQKIDSPIPSVCVRLVTSAGSRERAETILNDLASSFNQFQNTVGNRVKFQIMTGKDALELTKAFTFRTYNKKRALPLSIRELTTLMHLPTYSITLPQLKTVRAAEAPAPVGMPLEGTLLGLNEYRGSTSKIFLTKEDRLRHLYIVGQTGTGKTNFMKNLMIQDIKAGEGVCFIDPHGSDIEDVLAAIPPERIDDVIYFDPADTEHVLGLNMLEYDPRFPEQKTFVINELFSIFKKLYSNSPESMGPAFEQYFRNATALVMEDPSTGNTLLDISRVLADARYREVKLARSKNPVVNQFWREIATKAQGEASLQNIVPYITNKFDIFTANDIMRPIIGQQKSSFRLREVMDGRKILLVNLSKGKLGDINANLLGMVLVGKILMAALSRVDALASDLPHFYLYIDEFQNITTDSISAILSEARKYKLSLTIAHQFIAQLDERISDAVFGNVGSMAVFRVGAEDAEFFERQLVPTFEAQDIMNIENYHAYVRMLARGVPQTPFSITTLPTEHGSLERSAAIKARSHETHARKAEEVQREIKMRYSIG